MHKSISTIDSPEFIDLQPLEINPLMSTCNIKVLYVGENRNQSVITKEVATEMSKSLRGCPIVGYFKKDKGDFADHGEKMIIDDEGVKFECMTKPYGFVAPNAEVWFQKFEDTDEFGNVETREYLMTQGYLWTGQFEECKVAIDEGRPQSMELDEESLDGYWATNSKKGMDFFIINDATFSKLCILGDDVEPCFEGASVTDTAALNYTKIDSNFKNTLFSMMQDLKFALEGGKEMEIENTEAIVDEKKETVVEETIVETSVVEEVENIEEKNDNIEQTTIEENEVSIEEESVSNQENFTKKEESESKNEEGKEKSNSNEDEDEEKKEEYACNKDEEKKKYSLLEEQYNSLVSEYEALKEENASLLAFKKQIEDKEKDALIESFYMLSEEDKKEVKENKSNYTLDEIEAKLSVICVRNRVSFDLEEDNKAERKENVVTYSFNNIEENVPAYITALRKLKNENK